MNLYLERAAFLSPITLRVGMPELGADLEGTGGIALLILGICFPIKGCFCACPVLRGEIGEDLLSLRPMGIVDSAGAFRVECVLLGLGGRVVNGSSRKGDSAHRAGGTARAINRVANSSDFVFI